MSNKGPTELSDATQRMVPLWCNHNYLLLLGGQAVSSVGGNASAFALPLLILALTHSPAQAGFVDALRGRVIAACRMITYSLLTAGEALSGVLLQRIGVLGTIALFALVFVLLALVASAVRVAWRRGP